MAGARGAGRRAPCALACPAGRMARDRGRALTRMMIKGRPYSSNASDMAQAVQPGPGRVILRPLTAASRGARLKLGAVPGRAATWSVRAAAGMVLGVRGRSPGARIGAAATDQGTLTGAVRRAEKGKQATVQGSRKKALQGHAAAAGATPQLPGSSRAPRRGPRRPAGHCAHFPGLPVIPDAPQIARNASPQPCSPAACPNPAPPRPSGGRHAACPPLAACQCRPQALPSPARPAAAPGAAPASSRPPGAGT